MCIMEYYSATNMLTAELFRTESKLEQYLMNRSSVLRNEKLLGMLYSNVTHVTLLNRALRCGKDGVFISFLLL